MRLNIAYQKRAVELLNKKNAVFAYYTNFLNFAYNKYKVNNTIELQNNMREALLYKQTLKRSQDIRSIIRESEVEIFEFLDSHDIKPKTSLLKFAQEMNFDEQKIYFDNLKEESNKLDNILNELDEKYELIVSKLETLKQNDSTITKTITEIVNTFYTETERQVAEYR